MVAERVELLGPGEEERLVGEIERGDLWILRDEDGAPVAHAARRAYQRLGFARVGDYGLLLFAEPVRAGDGDMDRG